MFTSHTGGLGLANVRVLELHSRLVKRSNEQEVANGDEQKGHYGAKKNGHEVTCELEGFGGCAGEGDGRFIREIGRCCVKFDGYELKAEIGRTGHYGNYDDDEHKKDHEASLGQELEPVLVDDVNEAIVGN